MKKIELRDIYLSIHPQKHKIFCYYNIFTKQYTNHFFLRNVKTSGYYWKLQWKIY